MTYKNHKLRPASPNIFERIMRLLNGGGTACVNYDPIPITEDLTFHDKVKKVTMLKTNTNEVIIEYYRYDTNDLDGPLNQDKYLLTFEAGTSFLKKLPNDPQEHHLHRLPQRYCDFLKCGSCGTASFLGPTVSFCCR